MNRRLKSKLLASGNRPSCQEMRHVDICFQGKEENDATMLKEGTLAREESLLEWKRKETFFTEVLSLDLDLGKS